MRFGRDGGKNQQPVIRRSRRGGGLLVALLAAVSIIGVAVVLMVPGTTSETFFESALKRVQSILPANEPRVDIPEFEPSKAQHQALNVSFENLEKITPSEGTYAPHLKDAWQRRADDAAEKDIAINLQRAADLMNRRLEPINEALTTLIAIKPTTNQQKQKRATTIAAYRSEEKKILTNFADQSVNIRRRVSAEKTRRMKILRGLQ